MRDPFAAACCNQNHTQNSRSIGYYKLNGWPIGEIAQFALCTGALGVPLIFLSGEEAAYREAEELVPEIVIASVKVGLARSSVISLSAPMARALIEERIQEAVAKYLAEPWSPLVWGGPFELEKCFSSLTSRISLPSNRGPSASTTRRCASAPKISARLPTAERQPSLRRR